MAHELTHVVQQRQGAVSGSDIGGGLAVSDPSDRYEQAASANADRVMSSSAPAPTPQISAQRHADDEHSGDVAQRGLSIEGPEEQEEETGAGMIAQRADEDELQEDEVSS